MPSTKHTANKLTLAEIALPLTVCAGIFFYLTTTFWGKTYDDVFLAYQYAKNIEAGHGFVFNVGEHFLGTPAPLFVVLLVAVHTLIPSLTLPHIGTIISSAGLSLVFFALYVLGSRGGARFIALIIATLAIFNPFSLLVLGGESPLYLALITWAFVSLGRGRDITTGALLGLALMCRTEALIPCAVIAIARYRSLKRLPIALVATALATVLPWIVFSFLEFGSPLTNSFVAKVSQVRSGRRPFPFGFARWFQTVIFGENPSLLLSLIPAAFGAFHVARARSPYLLVVVWGVLQTLAYCSMPIPFYHWYAAHIGVLAAVLIGLGTSACIQDKRLALARLICLVCVCTTILTLSSITRGYGAHWPHDQANEIYTKAGTWFAGNTPPGARIAYLEIGQIGFYSNRYIIDTLGLVTPGVASHVASKNWLWPYLEYKPDYIILNDQFTTWPPKALIEEQPWFRSEFHEEARISTASYPAPLVIYKRDLIR